MLHMYIYIHIYRFFPSLYTFWDSLIFIPVDSFKYYNYNREMEFKKQKMFDAFIIVQSMEK